MTPRGPSASALREGPPPDPHLIDALAAVKEAAALANEELRLLAPAYVRHRDGPDGLWFLSIEVAFPSMVAARAIGVYDCPHPPVARQSASRWAPVRGE